MLRLSFLLGISAIAWGQAPDLGPAIGSTVPVFRLPDQNGSVQDLSRITGPKGAMLVFYRSADW